MNRTCIIFILLLSTTFSFGQIETFVSNCTVRGYTEWEKMQAQCCRKVNIEPLETQLENLLTRRLNIKLVKFFVVDSAGMAFEPYEYAYYNKNGLLIRKEFVYNSSFTDAEDESVYFEVRYHYSDNHTLDSIDRQFYAHINPPRLGGIFCEIQHQSKECITYDETGVFELERDLYPLEFFKSCRRIVTYNKKGLIKEIRFISNDKLERKFKYEYEYY